MPCAFSFPFGARNEPCPRRLRRRVRRRLDHVAAASGTQLAGTQWDLQTQELGIAGASDVESWIRFERAGRVTGRNGCNQFTGTYEKKGDDGLTFGPLAGTQKACAGPAYEVGRRVNAALGSVAAFSASGGLLNLLDSGGKTLLDLPRGRRRAGRGVERPGPRRRCDPAA